MCYINHICYTAQKGSYKSLNLTIIMHILSFEIYVYKLATLCATPSFCDQTKDFSFSSAHSKRGSAGRGAWLYADLCKCRATISNKKKKKIAKKTKGIREPRGDVWQKEMKENCALEKRPNRCQQQKCKSKGVKKKMKKKMKICWIKAKIEGAKSRSLPVCECLAETQNGNSSERDMASSRDWWSAGRTRIFVLRRMPAGNTAAKSGKRKLYEVSESELWPIFQGSLLRKEALVVALTVFAAFNWSH